MDGILPTCLASQESQAGGQLCAVVWSSFAELMLEGGWPSKLAGAGAGVAVEPGGEILYLFEADRVFEMTQ